MATYTIQIVNASQYAQNFFLFSSPPTLSWSSQIYQNALAQSQDVGPQTTVTYTIKNSVFASCVQTQNDQNPQVAISKSVAMDISSATNNCATFSPNPFNLTVSTDASVQKGWFRITTSSYSPGNPSYIGIGYLVDGISSFAAGVEAEPSKNLDVEPIVKFYVATGDYTPGTLANFVEASKTAACFDFTGMGSVTMRSDYQPNGTWTPPSKG